MNTKGFVFIIIGALFVCDQAYGLKHATDAHERLFTVICEIASFFNLCLL